MTVASAVLYFTLLAGPGTVHTEDTVSSEPFSLGTVYVVEQKEEAQRIEEESPHSVTVITEDRITGKFTSVADVLSEEVGVRINTAGGLGSFSTTSIRGSSGEQVTVLLDGIPLNEALAGGVNLAALPTSIIESIEVYRGSAPMSLGVSGIGGVIDIKTKRAKNKRTFFSQAQYGSFETFLGSAFYGDKPGPFDFSVAYEHRQSENDFEYVNDRGTKFNTADDRVEKRQNNEYREENVSLRGGYDFSAVRLDVINNYQTSHKGLPGTVGAPTEHAAFDTMENLTTAQAELQATDDLFATLKGYFAYKMDELDDRHGEVGGGSQDTEDITTTAGTDLVTNYTLGEYQTVSFIGRASREEFDPKDALSRITVPKSERTTYTAGLEDRIELFGKKVLVLPSLRIDRVENELFGVDVGKVVLGEAGDKTYDVWTPQIGLKYTPWPFLYAKANAGQYHRFPSFFELFGNNGTFIGNIDLVPERSNNFDVGGGVHFSWQEALLRYFSLEVTLFKNYVENLITIERATGNISTSRQVDEAEITGVETVFRLGLWSLFHFSGNITYQEAINEGPVKGKRGKQLPQRPVWEVDLFARLTFWKLEPFYNYRYVDKNYLNASNIGEVEARHLHNAGISYRPFDWLTATLEVQNITDKQY
ncbi:MAG: TonB-dependent receptor, partial [Deltaproteobacteria bacterium]|nr:TonB-dependent receptor [Deltaproteobacteria bacterium]